MLKTGMISPGLIVSLIITLLIAITNVVSYQVDDNPFKRGQQLDLDENKYFVEWEVDWTKDNEKVTFNVTVATMNWIGFGLSNDKKPNSKVDLVLGGLKSDGSHYFHDCHTDIGSKSPPNVDNKQNWAFIFVESNGVNTTLSFSRPFDTCDEEGDIIITISKICLNWSYGKDNNEEGTNVDRQGIFCLYLLDPEYAPEIRREGDNPTVVPTRHIPADTGVWSVKINRELPTKDTAYLCTMHRGPELGSQHTFIGYDVAFPNDESSKHIHHVVVLRCHVPDSLIPGLLNEVLFAPFLNAPARVCYIFNATDAFPMAFCNELFLVWGIGGQAFFLPDDVGFPFGGAVEEFFVFQTHYDNPNGTTGLQVEIQFDFFYIKERRPKQGAIMGILGDVPGPPEYILLEPHTRDHKIYGHCSGACTTRMFGDFGENFTIVAAGLHSHDAGKALKFHHFDTENEVEKPWILFDTHYDNRIQTLRHLRKWVVVRAGDQLTIDCNYDTAGNSVVGGFSTRQEMCMVFIVYIERGPQYSFCTSGIYSKQERINILGVEDCHWDQNVLEWVVDTPPKYKGRRISQISDQNVTWTAQKKRDLQHYQLHHEQVGQCHKDIYARISFLDLIGAGNLIFPAFPPFGLPNLVPGLVDNEDDFSGPVSYPFNFKRWVAPPGKDCSKTEGIDDGRQK